MSSRPGRLRWEDLTPVWKRHYERIAQAAIDAAPPPKDARVVEIPLLGRIS